MSPNATRWIQDSPQGDRQAALQAAVKSATQSSVQPVVKGKRELAALPDIQKGHHLHHSSLSPELQGKLLDWNGRVNQLLNPLNIAGSGYPAGEMRDAVKQEAWKRMDKAPIRAMLDEMNQMDREARKFGVPLSDFVNANGIIPRELAERLDGGSRFFDPEKLRGKLKSTGDNTAQTSVRDFKEAPKHIRNEMKANPSIREAIERAMGLKPSDGTNKPEPPMEGLVKAPEPKPVPQAKALEPKPVEPPKPKPSITKHLPEANRALKALGYKPAEAGALLRKTMAAGGSFESADDLVRAALTGGTKQAMSDNLSSVGSNKLSKVIDEVVGGDDLDKKEHFKQVALDAWKEAKAVADNHNDALRQLTSFFGKHHGAMAANLSKGVDVTSIKGFDELIDHAVREYPQLISRLGSESSAGGPEDALVEALKEGIREVPQPWDDSVIDRAMEMVGPGFFEDTPAMADAPDNPIEWEEESTPFSVRGDVLRWVQRYWCSADEMRLAAVSEWVDKYAQMMFAWDEAEHPREPAGSGKGGEFTKKPSGGSPVKSPLSRYPSKIEVGGRLVDRPPIYLSGKNSDAVKDAAKEIRNIGLLVTPATSHYAKHVDDYEFYGVDNGCYSGKGNFDEKKFYDLLDRLREDGNASKALFAVAPDVFDPSTGKGDWKETLERSRDHLPRIRKAGFPAAIVLQDGATADTVPWDAIDVLFVGGSTAFKTATNQDGSVNRDFVQIVREAKRRGIPIHFGRVNSDERVELTHFGLNAASMDGTFLAFGPDKNLPRLQSWLKPWGEFPKPKQGEPAKPKRQLKEGYVEQPRAKKGGEVSPVDGKFYTGGALMPVHGLFSGQEKPAPKPKKADGLPPVANEDQKDKGPRQVRERSKAEIEADRERMEAQRQWDELQAGPIAELFGWIGDRPNGKAFRMAPGHKYWAPIAERLGKDGVEELTKFMKARAIEREKSQRTEPMYSNVKKGMIDPEEQVASYVENIDYLLAHDQHFHTKKHMKAVPNSRIGEVWLGEFIKDSSMKDKLDLNNKLKELLGSKPVESSHSGNWAKLQNGVWGARIQSDREPIKGEPVLLRSKDGRGTEKKVSKVIESTGGVHLVEVYSHKAGEPTEAQKEAGNYKMRHIKLHGLNISIETPKGHCRREGWPKLAADYGYIKRTMGKDGDHIDVFIGPDQSSEMVYVIDQPSLGGRFDEHKCMLGFRSKEAAIAAYRDSYKIGWIVGRVTAMTIDQFKAWLEKGDQTKPIAPQVSRYSQTAIALCSA
jgi:hypothetical protein